MKEQRDRTARGGFTLVELLVAIGLFSVGVSIAVGGFVNSLKVQRQNAALLSANSNASLAIEQMNREIRTGFDFCVNGLPCSAIGGTFLELSFRNAARDVVTYRLQNGAIERRRGSGSFEKITADNVNIRHLSFRLRGEPPSDGIQPRITVIVGVSPKEAGVSENIINLQTTVSARTLDT